MFKLFHHVLFSRVLEQVNDQEMRDGKVFILLGIRVIARRRVQKRRREGGGGSKHVKGTINHQVHKFTPLDLVP